MRRIVIGPNETGQRLDKFLHKYMKEAPSGFFYKMMRKKNIVLNGKKCAGNELLREGDEIKLFFAEDTFLLFGAAKETQAPETEMYERAFSRIGRLPVLYENAWMLAVDKPAGVLSQKALPADVSLNEWLTGYLLSEKKLSPKELSTFHPSVCNRLDRNTSGLVLCSKSLAGSQLLTRLIRMREVRKFYRMFVFGHLTEETVLESWLKKDATGNQVRILSEEEEGADFVKTRICPIRLGTLPGIGAVTYAEAELFTGKTHQIRAHLSSIGHPLLGDPKYGSKKLCSACAQYGIHSQLLHAYRVEFPQALAEDGLPGFKAMSGLFADVAQKSIVAPLPALFCGLEQTLTRFASQLI